jgi:putative ubiquitin-RnfH superfamily antitoxin RatB of RatAB toxin-antitoxin module
VAEEKIEVEVAYARPERQLILRVRGSVGMTVAQAIERAGIAEQFPEIELASAKVGIFSKAAKMDQVLRAGDRVEIYRPLIADPKEARKKRAAQGKPMRKGAGKKKGP